MRFAGRSRTVATSRTTASPSQAAGHRSLAPPPAEVSRSDGVATAETELVLAPSGALSSNSANLTGPRIERYRLLAVAIRQRIETRLAGRVRDLAIRIHGETIVLEGRCATYYTKQLAQHAALGVLDGEPLDNAIVVST